MSKISKIFVCVSLPFVLASCAEVYEPKPVTSVLKEKTAFSNTASLSHMVIRDSKTDLITCTQPQPDAAFDQGESADVSVSLISLGGDEQGGEEEGSEEVEMAGRTPALLMTRELFYRVCEFSQNYKLDKKEAMELFNKTMDSVTEVWGTEAGNTTVTIGDTVTTTNSAVINSSASGAVTSSDAKPASSTRDGMDSEADSE